MFRLALVINSLLLSLSSLAQVHYSYPRTLLDFGIQFERGSGAGNSVIQKESGAGNSVIQKESGAGNSVIQKESGAGNSLSDRGSGAGNSLASFLEKVEELWNFNDEKDFLLVNNNLVNQFTGLRMGALLLYNTRVVLFVATGSGLAEAYKAGELSEEEFVSYLKMMNEKVFHNQEDEWQKYIEVVLKFYKDQKSR